MGLVEEAEPHLAGREQVRLLERLEREYGNIRAALRWAEEMNTAEGAEIGLRIAGALPRFWYKRGYMNEGREQLASVLASSPQVSELRPYRAKALMSAGILAHLHGDYASARTLYEECLAIQRELGDKKGTAEALSQLSMVLGEQGENASSDLLLEEALATRRKIGDQVGVAASLLHLGVSAWEKGDNISARSLLEESLAIRRQLGDMRGVAFALGNLGTLAQEEGDHVAAQSMFKEVLAIWREFGDQPMISHALSNLASVAYDEGDYTNARALHQESLAIRWKAHSKIHVLNDLVGLGRLAARMGEAAQGAKLLGATSALWKSMSVSPERGFRAQYEEGVALARAQLGEKEFTAACSEGSALSIEEVVEYALVSVRR
jgi:tetratricopeptide (TPR) repeat protein